MADTILWEVTRVASMVREPRYRVRVLKRTFFGLGPWPVPLAEVVDERGYVRDWHDLEAGDDDAAAHALFCSGVPERYIQEMLAVADSNPGFAVQFSGSPGYAIEVQRAGAAS